MSATYPGFNDELRAFVAEQKMFFVATAPSTGGSVNLSPKGYDSVRIIDDNTLVYLDLGGSGVETLAHVRENGRITFMWCAFEGAPNIVRAYGEATALTFDDEGFAQALTHFPGFLRARAIITVKVTRMTDSCGWGIPFYDFKGERDQLRRYVDRLEDEDEWKERRYARNAESIDGLPGLVKPK